VARATLLPVLKRRSLDAQEQGEIPLTETGLLLDRLHHGRIDHGLACRDALAPAGNPPADLAQTLAARNQVAGGRVVRKCLLQATEHWIGQVFFPVRGERRGLDGNHAAGYVNGVSGSVLSLKAP
jgi:hypothetical protein